MPAAVVVLFDVVAVDHEGLDGIAGLDGLASLPLVVQLGDGLADAHGRLGAGTGDLALSDQGLDVGGAVNAVDQRLGAGSLSSRGGTQSGGIVAAEDGDGVGMGGQSVGAVQVALLLVAHAVDLGDDFKAVAFDGVQEAVGAVHNGLHRGGIQHDDGAAVGALGNQVLAANLAGVVVIGTGVGHQLVHVGNLGVETEHGDVGRGQSVQRRGNAIAVNGVDEDSHDALGDQVFDQVQLLLIAVLGIQGDQLVAIGLDDLADGTLQRDEEGVGAVHAGVADLVGKRRGAAEHHGQGQDQYEDFLHG